MLNLEPQKRRRKRLSQKYDTLSKDIELECCCKFTYFLNEYPLVKVLRLWIIVLRLIMSGCDIFIEDCSNTSTSSMRSSAVFCKEQEVHPFIWSGTVPLLQCIDQKWIFTVSRHRKGNALWHSRYTVTNIPWPKNILQMHIDFHVLMPERFNSMYDNHESQWQTHNVDAWMG